ncbi:hypothetical protein HKBW3S43_01898, partial [Candidatus Hakubella thermalkaliphila]
MKNFVFPRVYRILKRSSKVRHVYATVKYVSRDQQLSFYLFVLVQLLKS